MSKLTIFYDGGCPLCVHEMRNLRKLDKKGVMQFEDIHADGFSQRFPDIDKKAADTILHAKTSDDTMLYGLDVTHAAWSLVGRGWATAPLRWPLVRWPADKAYLFFARNRYRISRLLTGKSRCDDCTL